MTRIKCKILKVNNEMLFVAIRNKLPLKRLIYFFRFTILARFDFLRKIMCYFNHLDIKLYTSKNYKKVNIMKACDYTIQTKFHLAIFFLIH